MIRYDELMNVVGTEEDAVSFLEEKGLLDNRHHCINGMGMTQCCILEIDNFGVAVRELAMCISQFARTHGLRGPDWRSEQ